MMSVAGPVQQEAPPLHAVTVGARRDLPRIRVLAESFLEHHPAGRFSAVVIDAEPGEMPSAGPIRFLTSADLPLADGDFHRMAMYYDAFELSAAVRPAALQVLLAQGATTAVCLDASSVVYGPLDSVRHLADTHGVVLTPHRLAPVPADDARPSEEELLRSGTFNTGFFAVSAAALPMLRWWQERLLTDCLIRPLDAMFADQRWIDLVPGLFDHVVLRDPGYNVGYWNLDHRALVGSGAGVTADGSPLRTIQFTGFDPRRPWVLSSDVADRPRVSLDENPVLQALCGEYAGRLDAAGARRAETPYRWDTLNDGTPVTAGMRSLYRRAVLSADPLTEELPPVPFRDDDADLITWLRSPVRAGGWVNRFLFHVWETRPDLQVAFPEPCDADEGALVGWAWQNVDAEPSLVVWLLPETRGATPPVLTATSEPGVNLAGYLEAEMGVGELSRLTAHALRHAGLPYSTSTNRNTISRQHARFLAADTGKRYPVTVAAVNADQFPSWAAGPGRELRRGQYTVGLWAWETEQFPDYAASFALVEEIWAISEFVAGAVRERTSKPVHVIPLPVLQPAEHISFDRRSLGLRDEPFLLFVFDYLSVLERKNPIGLVDAFRRAFPRGDGPTLVIKTINGDRFRSERARLGVAVQAHDVGTDDIVVVDRYLDREAVDSLMGDAAAYVSLHRSEGFGLTLAESMARGVPVIATGYSGNLDFMTSDNSLLVPHRRVDIGREAHPYPADGSWAEPDLDAAAAHMRWVVDNPTAAAALGLAGRDSIRRTHGLAVSARFVRSRVESITTARILETPPAEMPMNGAA